MNKVRVRIAPSPTGHFHIGNTQSALYNWLFARKNKGKFYLRIEDTDKARSTKESEQNIIEALNWLGLTPDPLSLGFGRASDNFVRQSDNLPRHKELLTKLLKEGKAFYCHHGQEDLETERRMQENNKEAPRHVCEHKNQQPTTNNQQQNGIIRLGVDENSDRIISFDDQIRGEVEFKQSLLGDFSIARAIDDPLYNFAVVADDNAMEVTHVIRGEDHISNTPKQILIYEALGFPVPLFAHLPLILGSDRSKLSKRHGGTATLDYRKDYLPEALLNFLGSLSYTFSKEIISKEEMIKWFDLKKVHKSGAVFNVEKLNWINSHYIKSFSASQLTSLPFFSNIPEKALPLITERLEKLSDVQNFDYFWQEPEYELSLLNWKNFSKDEIKKSLEEVRKVVENWDWEDKNKLRLNLDELSKKMDDRGLVYWPFRVALTGREKSPDPVEVGVVLGKEKVLHRIGTAIKKLV